MQDRDNFLESPSYGLRPAESVCLLWKWFRTTALTKASVLRAVALVGGIVAHTMLSVALLFANVSLINHRNTQMKRVIFVPITVLLLVYSLQMILILCWRRDGIDLTRCLMVTTDDVKYVTITLSLCIERWWPDFPTEGRYLLLPGAHATTRRSWLENWDPYHRRRRPSWLSETRVLCVYSAPPKYVRAHVRVYVIKWLYWVRPSSSSGPKNRLGKLL